MDPNDPDATVTPLPADLFGVTIADPRFPVGAATTKKKAQPKGYAAPPGSGPTGETCRSCLNYRSVGCHNKTYPKCALIVNWTHGPGTDIRAKSPACHRWERKT